MYAIISASLLIIVFAIVWLKLVLLRDGVIEINNGVHLIPINRTWKSVLECTLITVIVTARNVLEIRKYWNLFKQVFYLLANFLVV